RDASARPAGGAPRHLRRARRGGAGVASARAPIRPLPQRRAARRTLRRRTRPVPTQEDAMDFELTEEQIALRDTARKFAREVIAPVAAKYDRTGEFPYEVISKGFELGLMNLTVPAEYGGLGLSKVDQVLVVEELAAGCVGIATSMGANDLALLPILIGGTPDQKERFVRPFTEKLRFASFCLTEPGAGSDAAGLSTTAVRDGDHYVLNGTKMWITNGGVAEQYTVFATVDKARGHKGITCFVVEGRPEGLGVGKPEDKLGQRASNTVQLTFDNVRVPV